MDVPRHTFSRNMRRRKKLKICSAMFVVAMNAIEEEEEMERAQAAGKKRGGSKPGRK